MSSLFGLSSFLASACIDFGSIGQIMVDEKHAVPEIGLVGHWALDEGSGEVVHDQSEYKNNGSLVGGADGWRPWDGRYRGALDLSGARHVEISSASRFDGQQMTIAVWVRQPIAPTSDQAIITKGEEAWGLFRTKTSGEIEFHCCKGKWSTAGTGLADGQWHHVAAVYNGLRVLLYLDGVLKDSFLAPGPLGSNGSPIRLGQDSLGGDPFSGLLDDVLLYNRALSGEEIRSTILAGDPSAADSAAPGIDIQRLKLRGRVTSAPGQVTILIQGTPVGIAPDGTFEIELPLSEFEKGLTMESHYLPNFVTRTKIEVQRS